MKVESNHHARSTKESGKPVESLFIEYSQEQKTTEETARHHELYNRLRQRLMKATKQKKGDKVSLQPQLLANLKELIMLELSTMERASIAIYELQNFLIEICVYPKDHYDGMKFDQFFNWLVTSIRCEPKLWIKSSPMYEKICNFLKNSQAKLLELKKQAQEDDRQNHH